jgi:hypothetical protein
LEQLHPQSRSIHRCLRLCGGSQRSFPRLIGAISGKLNPVPQSGRLAHDGLKRRAVSDAGIERSKWFSWKL